jgi:hypothetical protein
MSTTDDSTTVDEERRTAQLLAEHGFDSRVRDGSVDGVPSNGAFASGASLVDVHELRERDRVDGYRIKIEVTQRDGEYRSTHKSWSDARDRLRSLLDT